MALLTVRTFVATGGAINRIAVNNGDTISGSDLGDRGVILDVNNGSASSINVTIVDPGTTPAGNPPATGRVVAVPAGAQRDIFISPKNVDPSTGVVTINYSAVTTVTAEATRY